MPAFATTLSVNAKCCLGGCLPILQQGGKHRTWQNAETDVGTLTLTPSIPQVFIGTPISDYTSALQEANTSGIDTSGARYEKKAKQIHLANPALCLLRGLG